MMPPENSTTSGTPIDTAENVFGNSNVSGTSSVPATSNVAGTSVEGEAAGQVAGAPAAVASDPSATRCKNCEAILTGRYCANCGQRTDVHVPSTRELVHEVLEGLTHSDSRLWRTLLSLWFRPGALTEEFLAGRRAVSLPPFRLYLIISIAFFLIVSISQSDHQFVVVTLSDKAAVASTPLRDINCDDVTVFNDTHPDWASRIRHACTEIRRDNAMSLKKNLFAVLPKALFVFLPLIAFLHMLLYWHPRRRYAEQLVFFLHLQALFFSVGIVIVALGDLARVWPSFTGVSNVFRPLLGWTLPIYTVFALRRVFKNGWLKTLLKASCLAGAYFLLALVVWLGALAYAALEL
jgi:hypothetical protein